MVNRLLSFGWSRKPTVSAKQYSFLLNVALRNAAEYRETDVIASEVGIEDGQDATLEMAQQLIKEVQSELKTFQANVDALFEIRPEPKELMELHIRAVGYLRGELEIRGNMAAVFVQIGTGDYQRAEQFQRKQKHFQDLRPKMRADLIVEILLLSEKHPKLYASLRLPSEVLNKLD